MKGRKSWREKMEGAPEAKLVAIPPRMQKHHGKGTMLIPNPADVDAAIRKVGKVITLTRLREKLARGAGADITCPLMAGMFVRIVAELAEEDMRAGKSRVTPYWRVVRDDGQLLETVSSGPAEQARHLEAEGHRIDTSGRLRLIF